MLRTVIALYKATITYLLTGTGLGLLDIALEVAILVVSLGYGGRLSCGFLGEER